MNQLVKRAGSRLRLRPHVDVMLAAREEVTARPILQEYDASTVEELVVNPAEFGNLAAKASFYNQKFDINAWLDELNQRFSLSEHRTRICDVSIKSVALI
jgi:hypothetical protein